MMRSILGFAFKVLILSVAIGFSAFAETITGRVDPAEQYSLSVGVSGVVKEISVREGERVLAGTLLLSLKDGFLKADVTAARSDLSLGQEELNETSRSFERDQSLFDEGSLAKVELDLAKIKLLRHKARVARLKADLAVAEQRLEMSKITAPFAGYILQLNTTKGQAVNMHSMSKPMLIFASSELKVTAKLPLESENIPIISTTVKLNLSDGAATGIVRSIRILDETQELSIAIESAQPSFQLGQRVTIEY